MAFALKIQCGNTEAFVKKRMPSKIRGICKDFRKYDKPYVYCITDSKYVIGLNYCFNKISYVYILENNKKYMYFDPIKMKKITCIITKNRIIYG